MTLPQFCQVAMLPQGRFQAFLRARSEERHALLQQVFQTGRFDRTERWLRDRRVELRRSSEAHQAAVADLVSRVSEVGGHDAPQEWPDDPALLGRWIDELTTRAVTASVEQAIAVEAASAAEVAASEASAAGIELAGLRATHAAARRAWAAVEAGLPDHEARTLTLARAHRAVGVRPLHELAARRPPGGARAGPAGPRCPRVPRGAARAHDDRRPRDRRAPPRRDPHPHRHRADPPAAAPVRRPGAAAWPGSSGPATRRLPS